MGREGRTKGWEEREENPVGSKETYHVRGCPGDHAKTESDGKRDSLTDMTGTDKEKDT